MAGTRTAPVLTGTATAKRLSVHYIDDSGDTWSEAHIVPITSTAAQRESFVDALQDASSASIYMVEVSDDFGSDGLADAGNADGTGAKSASLFDRLAVTIKHTTDPEKKNKIVNIPAPLLVNFVTSVDDVSDNVDVESAEFIAVLTSALSLFGAGWAIAWVRYVEHVEVNQKKRL